MMSKTVDQRERLSRVVVPPGTLLGEALKKLDRGGLGILLIVRDDGTLEGVITDGDLRRAILKGAPLTGPCESIANLEPVVGPAGIQPTQALVDMDTACSFVINHLPLVDEDGRVTELVLRSDLITKDEIALSAVVMAGGFGSRLHPLTADTPKPMLPVGGRPLIEDIVDQLQQSGIRRVSITTHFQSEKIARHFGDGRDFGVDIDYVSENKPLGTAGALGLLRGRAEPLLVINGDILTRVDFRAMLNFHREHDAAFTIGVRHYDLQVPYGIIESDGPRVRAFKEKPHLDFLVNAGIYLLEPRVLDSIPSNEHLDMSELIDLLLAGDQTIVNFPIVEYWLDIGQHGDYEQAQADVRNGRLRR